MVSGTQCGSVPCGARAVITREPAYSFVPGIQPAAPALVHAGGKTALEMLGTFTKLGEADRAFLARLYRTHPLMLRHIILRLLAPGSEALRQLDKLMIEEDERELESTHRERLETTMGGSLPRNASLRGRKRQIWPPSGKRQIPVKSKT